MLCMWTMVSSWRAAASREATARAEAEGPRGGGPSHATFRRAFAGASRRRSGSEKSAGGTTERAEEFSVPSGGALGERGGRVASSRGLLCSLAFDSASFGSASPLELENGV